MPHNDKIKLKNKICIVCGRTDQPHFAHKKCKDCAGRVNFKTLRSLPKLLYTTQKIPKNTGQLRLFKDIFQEREKVCEICEKKLYFSHNIFAHILEKGAYPSLMLNKENIVLLCYSYDGTGCHTQLDTKPESELKTDPIWNKIFKQREKLKQEYYKNNIPNL